MTAVQVVTAVQVEQTLLDVAKCSDSAFITNDFQNWKKALEKNKAHEMLVTHRLSLDIITFARKGLSVGAQINTGFRT